MEGLTMNKSKIICNKCGSGDIRVIGDYSTGHNNDNSWVDELRESYLSTIKCLNCGEIHCGLDNEDDTINEDCTMRCKECKAYGIDDLNFRGCLVRHSMISFPSGRVGCNRKDQTILEEIEVIKKEKSNAKNYKWINL
jgi:hypothetical protein